MPEHRLKKGPWKTGRKLPIRGVSCFFFAVFTAVDFLLLIRQHENVGQLLLDGSDAAWIPAFDDIVNFFGEYQLLFVNNLSVFDYIDRDIVVDEGEDIQIQCVDIALHLQNIFFSHFIAAGIFDNRNRAIQFAQL